MSQHNTDHGVRVVPRYDVDTLGAPFRVTLLNSVTLTIDPGTGEEKVAIPDVVGLINAVVRRRVVHTRKLGGSEIKFIRNALGLKAKVLAEFLDMSAEHLSRCESSKKPMAASSEKQLRLFAWLATFCRDPQEMLSPLSELGASRKELSTKVEKEIDEFIGMFLSMKIKSVFDLEKPLHFEFSREQPTFEDGPPDTEEHQEKMLVDAKWHEGLQIAV